VLFRSTPLDCANFGGSIFRGRVEFGIAKFNGVARFNEVVFNQVVDFSNSVFGGLTDFNSATFNAIAFMHCVFKSKADFRYTNLNGLTQFERASFDAELDFTNTTFASRIIFRDASFRDYVKFSGNEKKRVTTDKSSWDLQFARIEKPDHFSFHTLSLRPHWFVNVNTRKFDFTNVNWDWRNPRTVIREELERLKNKRVASAHRMLAIACGNLAVNAEDNNRYEEASRFRYMAMDARRRENWHGIGFWRLSWWYWVASGYGERALKALVVLLIIWSVSAVLYTQIGFARWEPKVPSESGVAAVKGDDVGSPLNFGGALIYSAAVMTFQKPEPRPATVAAQAVVLLETILGPVQAALLALAIRRKFMR